MDVISALYPDMPTEALDKLYELPALYRTQNDKVNLISRKDIENFNERHLLHSISLVSHFRPASGSTVLDMGTGGGFPGIPLAIIFPDVHFVLMDSIGKKIKVVNEIAETLKLNNVTGLTGRVESWKGKADYAVSRAVARINILAQWAKGKVRQGPEFGLWLLKGGDLAEEKGEFEMLMKGKTEEFSIHASIPLPFFESKKIIHAWQ